MIGRTRSTATATTTTARLKKAARILIESGFKQEVVLRAYKLAKNSIVLRLDPYIEVLVPSQRLKELPRERVENYMDLYQLLRHHEYGLATARRGRLPEAQHWYRVVVRSDGSASCQCPYYVYKRKVCVHIVAALLLVLSLGRSRIVNIMLEEKKERIMNSSHS